MSAIAVGKVIRYPRILPERFQISSQRRGLRLFGGGDADGEFAWNSEFGIRNGEALAPLPRRGIRITPEADASCISDLTSPPSRPVGRRRRVGVSFRRAEGGGEVHACRPTRSAGPPASLILLPIPQAQSGLCKLMRDELRADLVVF